LEEPVDEEGERGNSRDVRMVGFLTRLLDSNPNSKVSLPSELAALTENSFLQWIPSQDSFTKPFIIKVL
jgi:hypothetical protein